MFLPKIRVLAGFLALGAAMTAALFLHAPAYAQDGEPPAAPPVGEEIILEQPAGELPPALELQSSPPEGEDGQDGETPDEDAPGGSPDAPPAPGDGAPGDEAPPDESAPPTTGDGLPEDDGSEPPVDAPPAPEDAGDEDGEESPAPVVPDPWFRSGGVTYNFTSADCNPGVAGNQACGNPIQAAVAYVRDNRLIPDDLTIHVETGVFTENVLIDGDTVANPNNVNLQYVRYLTGAGSDPVTGTTLNGTLDIRNLLYGFNLSGFLIQGSGTETVPLVRIDAAGAVTVTDVALVGGGQEGMVITRKAGAVTLANVEARDNKNNGVEVGEVWDSGGGVSFSPVSGPVSVTSSVFNHNATANDGSKWRSGLSIATTSIATVNGVTASGNLGDGLNIFKGVNTTVRNSVLLNNSFGQGLLMLNPVTGYNTIENVIANGNGSTGMHLIPAGDLVLRNVQASQNGYGGLFADTCDRYQDPVSGKWLCGRTGGSVSVYGGIFNDNASSNEKFSGLSIIARGAITLADIEASGNASHGLYLDNAYYGSPVTLLSTSLGSDASGNGLSGARVQSLGAVTIQNLSANNNAQSGLLVETPDSYMPVLVSQYSGFNNNGEHGVSITTRGAITLRNIFINNNGTSAGQWPGAALNNHVVSGAPSYAGVVLYDVDFNGNDGDGVTVLSDGAITLYDVNANGNGLQGAVLVNDTGYAGVSIFPIGLVARNNFSDNQLTGLRIQSKGTVYLQRVRASNNGQSATEPGDGAHITTAPGYGALILADADFGGNDGSGLRANTGGAIIWTTGFVNNNFNGAGAVLINDSVLPAAVTLTGIKADGNADDGIQIVSRGFVTILGEISAGNNGGDGYDINNRGGYGVNLVAYTSWTDGNAGHGLQAFSNGPISVTGLTSWNTALGFLLDNAGGAGGVTLVNTISQANGVGSNSLRVFSKGAITLINVQAADNPNGNGAFLDNSSALYPAGVTISTGNFWNNNGYGLRIQSKGFVSLLYVATPDNRDDGLYIDNSNGYGVSIFNTTRQFNGNNQGYGLFVQSKGPVTVNGARFWGNLKGSYIDNLAGLAGVTLLYSGFDSTDSTPAFFPGLTVNSNGAIYLLKVETGFSADSGAVLNNASSSYYAGVTILSSDFFNTGGTGLTINSRGFITISQVVANNNATDGVRINNIGGYGVYIYNSTPWWDNNQGYAAFIESSGAVTVNNVNGLGGRGMYIDNSYGAGPVTIIDVLVSAFQTGATALEVHSKGYITLLNSFVTDGNASGVVLDNSASPYKYGVTVSGTTSRNSGGYGFSIDTLGAVTVVNSKAVNNSGANGYGLYVNNPNNIYPVTVVNSFFNNNSQDGVHIQGKGAVVLVNGEANRNGGQGIQIVNDQAAGAMPVTITGFRTQQNAYHGIMVFSKGAISLTSVVSLANGMTTDTAGAFLSSSGSPVYVYYSAFNSNGKQGLHVDTRGSGASGAFVNILNTYAGNDVAGGVKDVNLLWER